MNVRAYKTELDPNDVQQTALLRHAGAARWAFNWGLARKIEACQAGQKSPSAIDLHRELNALKKIPQNQGGVPWMYESSKAAPQEALRNLDVAFNNFFRRCKTGAKRKGFPRFKSRKRGIGSFTLTGASHVLNSHVVLPRIGAIRLKECGYLPADAEIKRAIVSERAGRWFVSVVVESPDSVLPALGDAPLGVDVGISTLATMSDGTVFENPRALRTAERKLVRLQRSVSHKKKGSANRRKAVARLARQHYRISCIRKDAIHKATSAITKRRPPAIGIESLNVAGMLGNHCLAKAVADASMSEFLRQIRYKAEWAGIRIVDADRFFPSSKTCSGCGHVKPDLSLSERTYSCESCGLAMGRDLNAAINLRKLAASSAVTACGAKSTDDVRKSGVKLSAKKQEPNAIRIYVLNG